jgi:predicted acylesterase/phospholipase RssA
MYLESIMIIAKKQRALILQGGGALGAYEAGVIKTLYDKIVFATSSGCVAFLSSCCEFVLGIDKCGGIRMDSLIAAAARALAGDHLQG